MRRLLGVLRDGVDVATVRTHVRHVLQVLRLRDRVQAVAVVGS